MRTLLIAASAAALLVAATPASAQVGFRSDAWGTDAQVGPLEFGVGPRYEHRYWRDRAWNRDDYAYAPRGDCRQVRERIVRPSGRVIYRTHRDCL